MLKISYTLGCREKNIAGCRINFSDLLKVCKSWDHIVRPNPKLVGILIQKPIKFTAYITMEMVYRHTSSCPNTL